MTFLLRLVFVLAGLLFAASLAVVFVLMLGAWAMGAAWAMLTGKPPAPFVRVDPRGGFERMVRRAGAGGRRPPTGSVRPRPQVADVTDVEPRPPSS